MVRRKRWSKWRGRFLTTPPALLAVCLCFFAAESRAVDRERAPEVRQISVVVNKSRTVNIRRPVKTATIASTAIADLTPMSDHTLYIQGKKVGTTNISVFGQDMQLVEVLDLNVVLDTESLQQKIRGAIGLGDLRVTSSNEEVILSGVAPDAVAADRAVSIAKSMVEKGVVVNAMTVAPTQQVELQVRFLEASRDAERDLGVNWFVSNANGSRGVTIGSNTPITTNPSGIPVFQTAQAVSSSVGGPFGVALANLVNKGTNVDVMITALETKGLVRRLAEPNLIALSGDTARFLAGGEFPVPILAGTGTGATPSIEFKKFGVSLAFTPTVLSRGLMNLRIAPEVSELDPTTGVTIQGTTVPGLVTRNAQTTVELRDGQSFAIAGLLQNRSTRGIDQLPWIGSVPVLGALFRSSAYQSHETDLVIIVTPHLVRPASPADKLATPFDDRLASNDVDLFVNGQLDVPKRYRDYVSSGGDVRGPYGYIIPIEQALNGAVVQKDGVAK